MTAEEVLTRRVRLLILCAVTASLAATVLNVGLELWLSAAGTAGLLLVSAATLIGYRRLVRRLSVRMVAHVTLGFCVVAIGFIAFGEGTMPTPSLHFLSIVIVASALLLGVEASRFWTVMALAASAITYVLHAAAHDASPSVLANQGVGLAIVLVALHLLASAAWRVADSSMAESSRAAERARAAAIELEAANTALAAAMQARSQFLANMSHEIRTPLNAVLGFTEVLLRTPLDRDQRQYVETIRGAGQGLLVIVDDVLDLARIEAGKLGLSREAVDLEEAARTSIDMLAVAAHKKGIEIWAEIEGGAPAHVEADSARVRQVLLNLIGNAVKFTSSGEVVVALARSPEPGMARIEVRDTGPGIEAASCDSLFQPFGQADTSTRRRHGGTGLGLVISKKLVEGMGGGIGFTSEPGEGSCFWVDLPAAPRAAPAAPAAKIAGVKVLLIEGRRAHSQQIARELGRHVEGGVALLPARSSAGDVVSAAAGSSHAIVVIDRDPAGDGAGSLAAELARADEAIRGVILLAPLSEKAVGRDDDRTIVLQKPVRIDRLLARITRIERDQPPVSLRPPQVRFDRRVLLVEDNAINQTIARLMLEDCGCEVLVARDGHEAVAMAKEGRLDLVLMDLHMPGMDGFDATRAIRADEAARKLPRVPIVALSAAVLPEDQARCLEAGMNGHLAKPITQKALEDVLRGISAPMA